MYYVHWVLWGLLLCVCWQVRERELEDSLRLMGLRAEVGRKGQEAQRLRGKMREMGLDKYEE